MADDTLPLILLADDESDDAFILQHRLAKSGIHNPVLAFSDGADVIEFLTKLLAHGSVLPRVLLLDLKMPRMDGFDTLQWIRGQKAFDSLTVAVVTSSGRPEDAQRALAAGAQSVFVKFPSGEELAKVVLASQQPRSPTDDSTP